MRRTITVITLCLVLLVSAAIGGTVLANLGANEGGATIAAAAGPAQDATSVTSGSNTPVLVATSGEVPYISACHVDKLSHNKNGKGTCGPRKK